MTKIDNSKSTIRPSKFKRFCQIGVTALMIITSVSSALAQPIEALNNSILNDTAIVSVIRDNVSKEDLSYIIKAGPGVTDARIKEIQSKIDSSIEAKYGAGHMDAVKNQVGKEIQQLSEKNNINVSYSWAMPQQILAQYKSARDNDSSAALGSFDISSVCSVSIKLAVDNNGRLFEASELASNTMEEMSAQSSKDMINTIKETVAHEVSHCVLHEKMKDPNFELSFSKEFRENNPEIAKSLNKIVIDVRDQIAAGKNSQVNDFDYIIFSNFQENSADVSGAFLRLGDNPTQQSIKDVRDSLINLAKFREKSDIEHQTHGAYQYALDKLDEAAAMSPKEREDFAARIASDSLIVNVKLIAKKAFNGGSMTEVSYMLSRSIEITQDKKLSINESAEKELLQDKIIAEYAIMLRKDSKLGTASQKIYSHQEIVAKYGGGSKDYKFNYDSVLKMRSEASSPKSESGVKPI